MAFDCSGCFQAAQRGAEPDRAEAGAVLDGVDGRGIAAERPQHRAIVGMCGRTGDAVRTPFARPGTAPAERDQQITRIEQAPGAVVDERVAPGRGRIAAGAGECVDVASVLGRVLRA